MKPILGQRIVFAELLLSQPNRYTLLYNFYPSARWARRDIVVPFVRRRLRLRRRRRTHSFG